MPVTDRPAGDVPAPDPGAHPGRPAQPATEEPSTPELFQQLVDQTKTLVKQEVRLAQLELQEKGKKVGIGAGMFGGAGLLGFYTVGLLLATIVLVLIEIGIVAWLSGLIVTVLVAAGTAVLALVGKKEIQQATPPAPEQAIGSVKQDVDTVKRRARR